MACLPPRNRLAALFIGVAFTGILLWALARSDWSANAQSGNDHSSQVFTLAHRTVLDAVKDFFNRPPMPVQPVAYPHSVHLANGMKCLDCHVGVDQGPDAVIPGVKFCMTCHQVIAADRPEIRKVAAYVARGEEIPWQRVYSYSHSAHVKFNHAPHIRANVACSACHGDMTRQTVAMRVVNLTMGYCIDCHKRQKASIDCLSCHF